jgi:hypothetical protein
MGIKINKKENPNIDLLLNLAKKFDFENISLSYYENILTFTEKDNLIGLINYDIHPSMAGRDRIYIKKLFYSDNTYIDNIIKSLCIYCKKNNLTIKTILNTGKFNEKCIEAFYNNNFTGKDIIYYLY